MNWDDDIDFLGNKKSAPKQGRRSSNNLIETTDEIVSAGSTSRTPPDVPIRAKRTGVWTEEGAKSAKNRGPNINIIEQERFQNNNTPASDDDIPIIPDIDDLQDDPLNLPDIKPVASVNKSTYKELDNNFENFKTEQINFGNLGDIDLSFLTSKLYPEKDVQTVNEIWTMESLFNDLSKM